ncbi:saccharopine dehydrogenase [Mesorhizobium alhagi CCNWXJ12-2]|uniref:Saccharopine dehydrogenase n=1 Tax=Mesorhizobium alhagi CCNWXJ12-2 TaxID=1107882 RepID=H0HK71_9HYPH|nr:saccharopine dehydrogenase [Mesorhizobium alhagi CCNWXJ12-2]
MVRILVIGGYGVFGGRLTERLAAESSAEILVAGRSLEKAVAHCRRKGGKPVRIDREGDIFNEIALLEPTIVIDAAGPFQAYGKDRYRIAEAAIAAKAHYLDLADDGAFVAGIGTLDDSAKAAGVAVIAGASSVPAISAAALDELVQGLAAVSLAGSAILPGNRVPRGLSVLRAIVGQAGRSLRVWRGGNWTDTTAWGDLRHFTLEAPGIAPLKGRLASTIGAPDLILFPERYGARSALFHAGLELKALHLGLWLLALPVRLGLVRSLGPLAGWLGRMAGWVARLGSDRGGMVAYAVGRDGAGRAVDRRWTLIAETGDGPQVPPTPALLLALKLMNGSGLTVGARPAAGLLTLGEIEAGLSPFRIRLGRSEKPAAPLLERVLPKGFATLPQSWRRLAEIHDIDCFEGVASVERGGGLSARLIGALFGFPPAAPAVAVSVTKQKTTSGEKWTRRFGAKSFVSHLSRKPDEEPGVLRERFGPFSFLLRLFAEDGRVAWPVESGRFLGIPLPRALMPRSEAFEYEGADGEFRFDVKISMPFAGLIVRYLGWLEPAFPPHGLSRTGSPAAAPSSMHLPAAQSDQPAPVAPEAASTISGRVGISGT